MRTAMLMHFNLQTPHANAEMAAHTPGPPRPAKRVTLLGLASVSLAATPDSRRASALCPTLNPRKVHGFTGKVPAGLTFFGFWSVG